RAVIDEHGPDAVAFYISGQLTTEAYYVFNKLAMVLMYGNCLVLSGFQRLAPERPSHASHHRSAKSFGTHRKLRRPA
ncbi:MAG TPA: molybdopterin-dependent oxidoreductase, partial [Thiobacillus sp.]